MLSNKISDSEISFPYIRDLTVPVFLQILYTGDFSRVEDRHLMAAEIPTVKPDVLITVSKCQSNMMTIISVNSLCALLL